MKSPPLHSPPARRATVLGFPLFAGDADALIAELLHHARSSRIPFRVDYLNAAQFNLAASDPSFESRLRSMDLLYADGQSIVWAARFRREGPVQRLSAADFLPAFLRRAAAEGVSLALVGGEAESVRAFSTFWRHQVPGLEIRYAHHGYLDAREEPGVIDAIRSSNADLVLVGMGAPRQEAFVERATSDASPRVWWCVGALFDYGPWGRRRAPSWMRRAGLEWAFRLAQEPRRLAGRYLIGNPLFVWRVIAGRRG